MIRRALVLAALLLLCALTCSAKTVYVRWDSPGPTFDGGSWDSAFHKVQDGLDASASGDEVWVAKGVYVECVALKSGVGLYGGFAGSETARDERDFRANETTLDGNGQGRVVSAINHDSAGDALDGFTIQNGPVGVFCYFASPLITNNTLSKNDKPLLGTSGGIWCENSSPVIINNIITENGGASDEGGIYCHSSSPLIAHNVIFGNTGSGIFCYDSSSPAITGNMIARNSGSNGGGVRCSSNSLPTITNNTICGNSATRGGGVYSGSSATIANNLVVGNSASYGGGIYCESSSPIITNNTITGNAASEDGGAIYLSIASKGQICNNIIAFNASGVYGKGTPSLERVMNF